MRQGVGSKDTDVVNNNTIPNIAPHPSQGEAVHVGREGAEAHCIGAPCDLPLHGFYFHKSAILQITHAQLAMVGTLVHIVE